jgi:hypothetical protein
MTDKLIVLFKAMVARLAAAFARAGAATRVLDTRAACVAAGHGRCRAGPLWNHRAAEILRIAGV